jgi:uncharacterized protein (TIGR02270 family)
MSMMSVPVVPTVLEQHVEELTTLWAVRDGLCAAADIQLRDLARFDERLAAQEDGCVLGENDALRILTAQLAEIRAGSVFGVAVVGLALQDRATVARCVALAEASPEGRRGLISALGWVEPALLRGVVKNLLTASSAIQRSLGLAACRVHGVDPGAVLSASLKDPDSALRAEALRAAGVLGQVNLVSNLSSSLADEDEGCRFWSAWSAVLLGNRAQAVDTLAAVGLSTGRYRRRAFRLACQTLTTTRAHEILRRLAVDSAQIRWVIEGSGIVGDPRYVPWLLRHMTNAQTARLAGEAFSLITGVHFGRLRIEGRPPEGFESGPTDDPDDQEVAPDPDEGLPWPDVTKTEKWWAANGGRFTNGSRYFMGAPVGRENCIDVLNNGDQRQRILAAHYLCLLEPGAALFNTSAPAGRQRRLLAEMG